MIFMAEYFSLLDQIKLYQFVYKVTGASFKNQILSQQFVCTTVCPLRLMSLSSVGIQMHVSIYGGEKIYK